jgi:hypothetical protein
MPVTASDPNNLTPGAIDGPAISAFAVTPSDTDELAKVTRGLYVGVAGDVVAVLIGDSASVTFKALAAGVVHPLRVRKVLSTGTTATNLLGMF